MELKELFEQKMSELTAFQQKAKEEIQTVGQTARETAETLKNIQKQLDALTVELDAQKTVAAEKPLIEELKENESLDRLMRNKRGTATLEFSGINEFERKTLITSSTVGSATSGVLNPQRLAGLVPAARERLFITDLLSTFPTNNNAIDYVKTNADISYGSPQTEASAKYENAMTFTTGTALVQTIASWIPATTQILEDFEGLQAILSSALTYAVLRDTQVQILTGSGVAPNLSGLTTQAQAFDTTLTTDADGWEKVDLLGRAIQQIAADNEVPPNVVILNPADYWDVRLQKATDGQYIFGNATMGTPSPLFGLRPLVTNEITAGYFLVGSTDPDVSHIRQRMGLTVSISTEHDDYFVKNKVAIRAEHRLAFVVQRPNAWVYGAFTTSP